MQISQKISPCLWFDNQAEAAVNFYLSVFKNAKIISTSRYGEAGHEVHGMPAGSVMTIAFEIEGQGFTALNGGPIFKFSEAISFQIYCDTQAEVDEYWEKLSAGGDTAAQQCGWLKDQFGVSWQVLPRVLIDLINDPDYQKSQRVMSALLRMKKIDILALQRAAA